MKRARALMVLGTSSHVGKSLITTALCRIFAQAGYRVAPFKSQNMSLNSAATIEGLEIGRAQALQAEAAGVAASVHMNPVLLKPCGNMSSQIVVHGKIWGKLSASEYHQRRVEELWPVVTESYEILAASNDIMIIEGAGSPAEINLKQNDIVNMRMAEFADAVCLLIGDIDRGGVFASIFGTIALLEPSEQARIRGFLINKFRGDRALLQPGVTMMVDRLAKPCLGVVHFLPDLLLDEEDSVGLPNTGLPDAHYDSSRVPGRQLRIVIVAFPSLSNFTDFDALRNEPSISLHFSRDKQSIRDADIVILPGSKQTMDDLDWMRNHGIADAVLAYATHGLVVGICGGMQILGEVIADPQGIEQKGTALGLGLLPLHTQMQANKITKIASGVTVTRTLFGQPIPPLQLTGYEIHVGASITSGIDSTFARLRHASDEQIERFDGCVSADSRILGTYLHGLFDEDEFRHAFIVAARAFHRLSPASVLNDWKTQREFSFNRVAQEVRDSVDLQMLYTWLGLQYSDGSRIGGDPH